jgi:hypothetical protein
MLAVRPFQIVRATLAGRARTITAQAAWVAHTKPATGRLRALLVQQAHIPTRQLPAVSVVQLVRTRQKTDHSVSCVRNTQTLRPGVTILHHVSVMPVGWEEKVAAQPVWLENIRPTSGLLRALTVRLGNFQMLSMHP